MCSFFGSVREKNGDLNNSRSLRKLSNVSFLGSTLFTLGCFLMIHRLGANLIFLFIGLVISLFILIFSWKSEMQRYDDLVKQPVIDYSNRKKIFYILIFLMLIPYLFFKLQDIQKAEFSVFGGLTVTMWFYYFQLIYWEKKNHKTIYLDKSYGTWKKSVTVLERK